MRASGVDSVWWENIAFACSPKYGADRKVRRYHDAYRFIDSLRHVNFGDNSELVPQ